MEAEIWCDTSFITGSIMGSSLIKGFRHDSSMFSCSSGLEPPLYTHDFTPAKEQYPRQAHTSAYNSRQKRSIPSPCTHSGPLLSSRSSAWHTRRARRAAGGRRDTGTAASRAAAGASRPTRASSSRRATRATGRSGGSDTRSGCDNGGSAYMCSNQRCVCVCVLSGPLSPSRIPPTTCYHLEVALTGAGEGG